MFVVIFLLWIIFNGRLAWDVVISGLIVSAAVSAFAVRFCNWNHTKKWNRIAFMIHVPGYILLLLREIFFSNLQMIRMILSPKMEEHIAPMLVHVPVKLKDPVIRTLLANSITLTPGTITVQMQEDAFIVHAINPEMGEDLEHSAFSLGCEKLESTIEKAEREA